MQYLYPMQPSSPLSQSSPLSVYRAKANFPFILNFSPYFQNNTGNGTIPTLKKANKLVAQSTPKFSYIYVANNGNPAAMSARAQAMAAKAELALRR